MYRVRRNAVAYGFLLPNLVLFAAFLLLPAIWVVRQSFMTGGVLGPATWVGLDNWRSVFSDSDVVRSLRNTLQFTVMAVPVVLALAMLVALLLREVRRGSTVVRAIVYLPTLAPIVLAALVWVFVVHPEFGLLNIGSRAAGLEPVNWLGSSTWALPSIVMLEVWRSVGFWALFLLAALLAVSPNLYSAAALDGASRYQRFLHVTLPGVRVPMIVAVLLTTILSMQVFDSVFVLTQGGPDGATDTIVYYIYRTIFQSGNPGYGAAVSLILVLVIVAMTLVLARVFRERKT
jgi:multiple sugar transport system permease protein/sn-glycerol 3-phosphate transport system permease protein